jgi:HD-GYP domain-containing protein (c-di-GMP phosphodiesterase class II)
MSDPERSAVAPTIPWHRGLEARVLLCLVLIAGLSTVAIVIAAHRIVSDYSLHRSREDMAAAQRTFQRLTLNRARSAADGCRMITELPIFTALIGDPRVMSEKDSATMRTMAEDYRRKMEAEFCLVTDPTGRWLGRLIDFDEQETRAALAPAIKASLSGDDYEDVIELAGGLYLVVSQPARFAEEVLGTLTFGFRLDDRLASELAGLTHCEVSFAAGQNICASSLLPNRRDGLAELLRDPSAVLGIGSPSGLVDLNRHTYVAGVYPLSLYGNDVPPGRLLLLHSWLPTQRVLDAIKGSLLYVGLMAFLLSLAVGVFVSHRLSRPLHEIAIAAGEVAAGDWDRKAPVRGSAEAAVTATAFNHMTANLRHYYQEARRQSDELSRALDQLEESYTSTLQALSRALDTRDDDTEGHSQRVTYYAIRLGQQLRLDQESLTRLEFGALLHDLGKIGIPDSILRKPGPLNRDETQVMRGHCDLGVKIVRGIPHLQGAMDVIQYHHERYDGAGYPHGLEGDAIPLVARIFAVADALDAMTSDRPYRQALSFPEAITEIQRGAGAQFDPRVVEAVVSLADEFQHWRQSGCPPPFHHLRLSLSPETAG